MEPVALKSPELAADAVGYGGIGSFLPAERTLIRAGLPEPLAKRGRGGTHDPGEPTEDGHDPL